MTAARASAPLSGDERGTWLRLLAVLELLPAALDSQLQRDSAMTHFEYFVLASLSEAPKQRLRMSHLAATTNSTLPRLSHVVSRLESRGLVQRTPCQEDGRATNAVLTPLGAQELARALPGHLDTVRDLVLEALTAEQLVQLGEIAQALVDRLDPEGRLSSVCRSISARADAREGIARPQGA